VTCRAQRDPADCGPTRWILVPQVTWAPVPGGWGAGVSAMGRFAFPLGSSENRRSSRARANRRITQARRDVATLPFLCEDQVARAGCLVARPAGSERIVLEAVR
jgi:hypothetical protein